MGLVGVRDLLRVVGGVDRPSAGAVVVAFVPLEVASWFWWGEWGRPGVGNAYRKGVYLLSIDTNFARQSRGSWPANG